MASRTFNSRVSVWLVLLCFGLALLPSFAAVVLVANDQAKGIGLLAGWGVAMTGLLGLLTWPTRYQLESDQLLVRTGVLRWPVPYQTIRGVRPSRRLLVAPAWGWPRLRLDLADGSCILVSPDDPESFIDEIAQRSPHLVRTADGLAHPPAA